MNMEGKKAPAFSLQGQDGKIHTLKKYQGKYVVLYFYPKDNTLGCIKEACEFRDAYKNLERKNVIVLGISKDTISSHQKFAEKFNLPFVLLSDPDGTMIEKYKAWGEKKNYGKNYMGIIRSTLLIDPNGIILKHWPKVQKAEAHPKEVLDYLENRMRPDAE